MCYLVIDAFRRAAGVASGGAAGGTARRSAAGLDPAGPPPAGRGRRRLSLARSQITYRGLPPANPDFIHSKFLRKFLLWPLPSASLPWGYLLLFRIFETADPLLAPQRKVRTSSGKTSTQRY